MIKAIFYFNDKSVTVHHENTELVTDKFQPGYYHVYVERDRMNVDCIEFSEVHEPFPNQRSSEVLDTVFKFLNHENKKACNEMGYNYKLNILLHGGQGVGKTALMTYVGHSLYKNHDAIVFRIDGSGNLDVSWKLAEEIRRIQDNPIIFLMDEFDQYCAKNNEAHIKSLLDGNRSIDNSIVLAATNYLERIPATLRERPSRFRIVSEIEAISDKQVIADLIMKIHEKAETSFLSEEDIKAMCEEVQHATVDDVKTFVLDKLMDLSLDMPQKDKVGFKTKDKGEIDMRDFAIRVNKLSQVDDWNRPSPKEPMMKEIKPFNHESDREIVDGKYHDHDEPSQTGHVRW